MPQGKIWVADHDGVYLIRMVGDVRLTLCMSFDHFIDSMFAADDFAAIIFDLSEADAIDSTTLGLMAKISILSSQRKKMRPSVIATTPGMNRLLESMGFGEIFDILQEKPSAVAEAPAQPLVCEEMSEQQARAKVLEAHRILMQLNEKNKSTFQDLVRTLENSQ